MAPRARSGAGTFVETVTPDAVRDVFDRVRGPVVTSSDVADALDCTTEAARQKLTRLYDRGEVDKRKTGRTVVYWRGDPDAESGRETREERSGGFDDPRTGRSTDARTSPEHDDEESDAPDPIGDALDGWLPDTEANPRTARAQTRRAAEYLRSTGEYRRKKELVDALAADSTLGRRTWWERSVRPGLRHLAEHDLVEYTRNRGWRWIGPDATGGS